MGSRRDARQAGNTPKKTPTVAEKPSPSANDHQGSETGKPDTRLTARPITETSLPLPCTRQLWLFASENMPGDLRRLLTKLKERGLNTGRAWAIKEALRKLWDYKYEGSARKYFEWWYCWAVRSQLKPIVEVAKMLKRHQEGLLNFISQMLTNAMTEGLNSKVQHLKYSARGRRNFESYRRKMLFYCGKLVLKWNRSGHGNV